MQFFGHSTILTLQYCCIVIMTICISAKLLNYPLTENDIRYAMGRCTNEFAGSNQTLKTLWAHHKYPDDRNTHCFIKCFLYKLGLIDQITKGLNFKKLYSIWTNMDLELSVMCPRKFKLSAELDGKCRSYYEQWMKLRNECNDLVKYVTFEKNVRAPVKFRIEVKSKPVGVKASEHCRSVPKKQEETDKKSGEIPDGFAPEYKCKLNCIFRHFRYFDGYGRFDVEEITRSFDDAHQLQANTIIDIQNCTDLANSLHHGEASCDMSLELRKCLQKHSPYFYRVFRIRDMISRRY